MVTRTRFSRQTWTSMLPLEATTYFGTSYKVSHPIFRLWIDNKVQCETFMKQPSRKGQVAGSLFGPEREPPPQLRRCSSLLVDQYRPSQPPKCIFNQAGGPHVTQTLLELSQGRVYSPYSHIVSLGPETTEHTMIENDISPLSEIHVSGTSWLRVFRDETFQCTTRVG
jgi:hypothetical protein